MIIYYCDRCGNDTDGKRYATTLSMKGPKAISFSVDLCVTCAETALNEFRANNKQNKVPG